ncbi:hypothetical protein L3Y34_002243 [Caenorhabditis briggsae]|uniref:SET domain-containing protein n=2 Tax=Caenorhabditis briggsae TaxID=6238 RepID=A0AAE9ISD2_CAEBR|nr:hypothetical protein L3Y34_002243 [Caenorhabditis briggsae]
MKKFIGVMVVRRRSLPEVLAPANMNENDGGHDRKTRRKRSSFIKTVDRVSSSSPVKKIQHRDPTSESNSSLNHKVTSFFRRRTNENVPCVNTLPTSEKSEAVDVETSRKAVSPISEPEPTPPPKSRRSKSKSARSTSKNQRSKSKTPSSTTAKLGTGPVSWRNSETARSSPTGDESDDDTVINEEKLRKIPTMIVVDPSIRRPFKYNERIRVVPKFEPSLPRGCGEAKKAEANGTWSRKRERKNAGEEREEVWPGIPDKKYGKRDEWTMNKADREAEEQADGPEKDRIMREIAERQWVAQALFECPDDPTQTKVLYEGWSSETMSTQMTDETNSTAPIVMMYRNIREKFLAKMKEEAEIKAIEFMNAEGRKITFKEALAKFFVQPPIASFSPTSRFWLYQDMDYFHSMQQKEHLLGPIWYMAMRNPEQLPPFYAYSSVNIVDKEAFDLCKNSLASLSTPDLIKKFYKHSTIFPGRKGVCSNSAGCKCNQRFNILYGLDSGMGRRMVDSGHVQPVKQIKHDSNGILDLADFRVSDLRVIMECSDECGCPHTCPRRRLQQGQTKPMVIYHEGEKGFGIRAAEGFKRGELICEYTGKMFVYNQAIVRTLPKHAQEYLNATSLRKKDKKTTEEETEKPVDRDSRKKRKPTSYQAGFSVMNDEIVICAGKEGNIARFANHSCEPNAAFFEVHSRRYVSDPLIPRVAIYATKDIALGEEVTVAYWDPTEQRKKTDIECRCGTASCMKFLPK